MAHVLQIQFEQHTSMTDDQWVEIEKNLGRVGQVAGLLKFLIGAGAAVVMALAGGMLWVNTTTKALSETQDSLLKTQQALASLEAKRDVTITQWTDWRRAKDEIDTRLTTIVERQQIQIDRADFRANTTNAR